MIWSEKSATFRDQALSTTAPAKMQTAELARGHMQGPMQGRMIVLGIETTCDETAAALVERAEDGRGTILSNIVLSQIEEHAAFGGVVPEIAARAHVEALDIIIAAAMRDAGRGFADIDGVAAAARPRLI